MPQKIGRYQVTRELGHGGMGVVYLAQDPFIDRLVAIKTTLSSLPKDPQGLEQFQQRFFNEAQKSGQRRPATSEHLKNLHESTTLSL